MEGARVARSYWSVLLALKDINGCEPVNEKKLSNLEIWKFLQKNDFVFAHIAYFCCYKLQYFSGVSKKGGPEAKHKFLKKVSKKGGSVQKRGTTGVYHITYMYKTSWYRSEFCIIRELRNTIAFVGASNAFNSSLWDSWLTKKDKDKPKRIVSTKWALFHYYFYFFRWVVSRILNL